MPFNLEFINNVSSNEELITISFNSEDLDVRNQDQIAALKAALLRFKKVKFRLEKSSSKNLFAFMRVIQNFLNDTKQLEDFDISDSGFLPQLSQSGVQLETKTEQIKFKRNQYLYNEKMDAFITALFKQPKLKKLNLSHNLWLLKEHHARRIGLASRQGMWIDLRHTHRDGEYFTLDQLYLFVKPDPSPSKPLGQVLVSFKELPKTLQDQLTLTNDVNLVDIVEIIIQSKRKSVFDAKIAAILESASSDKFVVIAFEPPLEHLTDEETQQLACALKEPSCRVSRLNLPPCNLSYLTEVIKTHHSLGEVNVSKLNASPEMVSNLATIIASNSKIRRIKLDYRMLLLETNFNAVIQAILKNDQSKLKSEQKIEQQHIELIDTDENLLKNPNHLLAIIKNIRSCPAELNHIQMVVDLSRLEFDCQLTLANQKILPFPQLSDFSIIYEEEEEIRRMKPLLLWERQFKFILTPCYDTYSQVMKHMELYLQNRLVEKERLEKERLEEERIEQEQLEKARLVNEPLETKHDTTFSFFSSTKLSNAESAYNDFIHQKENTVFIHEKPFIIPYLKAIFEANENEDVLNTTARIFLLAAMRCRDESEVQLLFDQFNEGKLWGSNAPWANCRTELCAFMEKHQENTLDLVTNSFFAFYHTLPDDEKEIYERVSARFYPVAEYEVTGLSRSLTCTLGHPSLSHYFNFSMPLEERIAAVRLVWNGVFISWLPELNDFFENDEDRSRHHAFRTAKLDSVNAESIKGKMRHHLNTRFFQQLLVAYAEYARTKTEKVKFTPDIHANLLLLSQELDAACQPWDKENSKRSTDKNIYKELRLPPSLLGEEVNQALPYAFKPTDEFPHFYGDTFDSSIKIPIKHLLQQYSNASGKSDERIDQFAQFQKGFNGLLDKSPIDYKAALKYIEKHRSQAIQADAKTNEKAWFKLNRKGHSRYLTMLTDIENKIVTAWATDPRALFQFPKYLNLFKKRINQAILACQGIPAHENPLANLLGSLKLADTNSIQLTLTQLNQQLNSDQLAGHVQTLAQPLKDLLETYQAALNTQNEDKEKEHFINDSSKHLFIM